MENVALNYFNTKTSFGRIHLVANESQLLVLAFDDNWSEIKARIEARSERRGFKTNFAREETPLIKQVVRELEEFAVGKRTKFSVPLNLSGTDFERQAWSELRKIPFGKTRTYRDQAERLDRPQAVRAVGAANARNPIAILIPCHRVISESGALTGYSGGLAIKEKLLKIEGHEF